jgi:hypothetical protein
MSQVVYVVSNVGTSSPLENGKIFGAFSTLEEANKLASDIEANQDDWGIDIPDDEVAVNVDALKIDKVADGRFIYLVSDVGEDDPCMGILFGAFSTMEEALLLKKEIESDAESNGLWNSDDTVGIHTLTVGQIPNAIDFD